MIFDWLFGGDARDLEAENLSLVARLDALVAAGRQKDAEARVERREAEDARKRAEGVSQVLEMVRKALCPGVAGWPAVAEAARAVAARLRKAEADLAAAHGRAADADGRWLVGQRVHAEMAREFDKVKATIRYLCEDAGIAEGREPVDLREVAGILRKYREKADTYLRELGDLRKAREQASREADDLRADAAAARADAEAAASLVAEADRARHAAAHALACIGHDLREVLDKYAPHPAMEASTSASAAAFGRDFAEMAAEDEGPFYPPAGAN